MNDLRTCFKQVDYDLAGLLHYVDIGDIGLPDIQRPFVWSTTKVRDLFDSMYRGFPVGYLLFWENNAEPGAKQIGTGDKAHKVPHLLIVDGQQRLTSLYAVFRGREVMDKDYRERRLEVAFNPVTENFAVPDAAIRRNPEYIPDISQIWSGGESSYRIVSKYLGRLNERRPLGRDEEEQISQNLERLLSLQKYPFTALEIASNVEEEQVADIFVRINSEGVKLNQADFILTLLSVFWDEGREQLERFSRDTRRPPEKGVPSAFNHYLDAEPDQLLRVAVAVGFYRGRLQAVYQVLRGKDPATGTYTEEKREQHFGQLKKAQEAALDLNAWHQFFSAVNAAGFRHGGLISSKNALLYTYALYLVGRDRFGVPVHQLDKLIGRWFYAASITSRYTGSFESQVDEDFGRIKALETAEEFVDWVENRMSMMLTNDFWKINLPSELATSAARSPTLFGFFAAQVVLDAPVLFSHKKVGDMLDPATKGPKAHLERHHLFPQNHLKSELGIEDTRQINQIANLAYLEWPENIAVSDASPAEYVPAIRRRFSDMEWSRMLRLNALPSGWENMNYWDFLERRRELMAELMQQAYSVLSGQTRGDVAEARA